MEHLCLLLGMQLTLETNDGDIFKIRFFLNENDHINKSSTWGFDDPWSSRMQSDHNMHIKIRQ